MYIEPQTNIRILKNVPLDTSYDHTIYFGSKTAQANYFLSKEKYNLRNFTYQRVKRGWMRVGIKADNLYDCNYLMFQNTAYGDKWFYAFIKSVEYVNDVTANIEFEIDDMQTWHFDYTVDHCFVEREHVTDDTIGAHIEPENVECGEYVFNNWNKYNPLLKLALIVAVVDVTTGDPTQTASGNLYDAIYSGASLYIFESEDVEGIDDFVSGFTQKPDAIISMYLAPWFLFQNAGNIDPEDGTQDPNYEFEIPDDHRLPDMPVGARDYFRGGAITTNATLDGYKPKNNKLYTYPYNFFHMNNGSGSQLQLRYEFFRELDPIIEITGTVTQPVVITARPVAYKNVGNDDQEYIGNRMLTTETLTLDKFPLCSWNTDAYEAWVAQNAIPIGIGLVAPIVGTAVGAMINPLAGAVGVGSAISQVASVLTQDYKASIQADIMKGNFGNGNANIPYGMMTFFYGRCSVSEQYARIIDDYFNMFGYAVKRCKVPNRNARPHWNYVKTIGCTLTGSVPADSMRHLCQIYDHGITFWNNGDEIGRYDLDNTM